MVEWKIGFRIKVFTYYLDLDDVSLVPGEITIDPQEVDITTTIGGEN